MFEEEIKKIAEYYNSRIKDLGQYFTYEQLLGRNLHPAILQYVSAEIDYLIYEDRKKLLKNSAFDYSGEKISYYFLQIADEIKKSKRFSAEFVSKLIFHAVTFNTHFVARPIWTLVKFVYMDGENKTPEEIKHLLNYVYFYPYLPRVIQSYFSRKKVLSVGIHEFESLLRKIDEITALEDSVKLITQAVQAIKSIFNFPESDNPVIPVKAVKLFAKEKNLNYYYDLIVRAYPDDTVLSSESELLQKLGIEEKSEDEKFVEEKSEETISESKTSTPETAVEKAPDGSFAEEEEGFEVIEKDNRSEETENVEIELQKEKQEAEPPEILANEVEDEREKTFAEEKNIEEESQPEEIAEEETYFENEPVENETAEQEKIHTPENYKISGTQEQEVRVESNEQFEGQEEIAEETTELDVEEELQDEVENKPQGEPKGKPEGEPAIDEFDQEESIKGQDLTVDVEKELQEEQPSLFDVEPEENFEEKVPKESEQKSETVEEEKIETEEESPREETPFEEVQQENTLEENEVKEPSETVEPEGEYLSSFTVDESEQEFEIAEKTNDEQLQDSTWKNPPEEVEESSEQTEEKFETQGESEELLEETESAIEETPADFFHGEQENEISEEEETATAIGEEGPEQFSREEDITGVSGGGENAEETFITDDSLTEKEQEVFDLEEQEETPETLTAQDEEETGAPISGYEEENFAQNEIVEEEKITEEEKSQEEIIEPETLEEEFETIDAEEEFEIIGEESSDTATPEENEERSVELKEEAESQIAFEEQEAEKVVKEKNETPVGEGEESAQPTTEQEEPAEEITGIQTGDTTDTLEEQTQDEEGRIAPEENESEEFIQEVGEEAESQKGIDPAKLLENKHTARIIESVFDYDMEEFTNAIEQLSGITGKTEALEKLDEILKSYNIDSDSKEGILFKEIISDYFNKS